MVKLSDFMLHSDYFSLKSTDDFCRAVMVSIASIE